MKKIYLEGLNGIRAMAAIAVVVSHTTLSLADFGIDPYIFGTQSNGSPRGLDLAGYGVSMFFALSGFLITFLLCKEKERLQTVNIKKFYMRRILRIWPLYYAYLLLCILLYFVFDIKFNGFSIYFYVFYGANIPFIVGSTLPLLAHYWSLGVEEQFYVFWPWLCKLTNSTLLYISLGLIFLLVAAKVFLHLFIPNTLVETAIHVTRFHCMLMGAVSAILYYYKNKLFIKIATAKVVQLVCWLCLLLVATNQFHIASLIDNELITGITCLIIIGQITNKGLINLENNVFDFLGKVSYGIYVIHPVIIFIFPKLLQNLIPTPLATLNYAITYTSILGTTILLAHFSYQYFEKPFLAIKTQKYSVIPSAGSKHHT